MGEIIADRLNFFNNDIYRYIGGVYEYDMKNAYPSILKGTDFVFNDKDLRRDIEEMSEYSDKKRFLIRIGIEMGRNGALSSYISEEIKRKLVEFQVENGITSDEIIAIKKDAIFSIRACKSLKFGNVNFGVKNTYSMFFYDYIKKHEYYIDYKLKKINYSIKGLGKDYDTRVYDLISRLIYNTLSNSDLSLVRHCQKLFLNNNYDENYTINKIINYLPSHIPVYESFGAPLEEFIEEFKVSDEFIKGVYEQYYSTICKCLIRYII